MTLTLDSLGFDADFAAQIRPQETHLLVGRAIFGSRGIYHVLVEGGDILTAELKGILRKGARGDQGDYPVVGDWMLLEPRDAHRAIIVRALQRRNALVRREQSRREAGRRASSLQILAANIDWGLITTSINEEWNARRLERYIGLVRESKAKPAILLTKSDLAEDGGKEAVEATRALSRDIPVLLLCVPKKKGLRELKALLDHRGTAVMIGSSGVGKSTLVNALMGDDVMATAEIREKDSRGRHTTAGRHLLTLPGGGCLIDSPGLRDLGLVEEESVHASYDDITDLATRCRFSDCRHSNEPGCAVREALASGSLEEARWLSFVKLRDETAGVHGRIKGLPQGETMKSFTRYLSVHTQQRREILNITSKLESLLAESGIKEGLMLVNPMHITASVYVNDAEPGLYQDIMAKLEELAPAGKPYQHHRTGEDNGDAHLKRQLLGQQVVLAVTGGRLDFGPWEQVHYAEFDGRRAKRILVKIIGE